MASWVRSGSWFAVSLFGDFRRCHSILGLGSKRVLMSEVRPHNPRISPPPFVAPEVAIALGAVCPLTATLVAQQRAPPFEVTSVKRNTIDGGIQFGPAPADGD